MKVDRLSRLLESSKSKAELFSNIQRIERQIILTLIDGDDESTEFKVINNGDVKKVIKDYKTLTILKFIGMYRLHREEFASQVGIDVFKNGSELITDDFLVIKIDVYFKDGGRVYLDFGTDGNLEFDSEFLSEPGDEKMGELFYSNIKRKLIAVKLDDFLVKIRPDVELPKNVKPKVDIE